MRLNKITGSLVAGAMTLSVFGVASARTGRFFGTPAPHLFGASHLLGSPHLLGASTVDIQSQREVDLPPEQQLSIGQSYLLRMDQGTVNVRNQLEQARAARDVVKTLCLNDKLNQIDVANRTAKDRHATLRSAVQSKDKDRSRHEFIILQSLRDRIEQIVKEANQCIGEEAGFIGDSHVTLEIDPTIPDNNPAELGSDPDIISEPPVLSSPIS